MLDGYASTAYAGRYADAEYTLGDAYVTRCNTELVSTRAPPSPPPARLPAPKSLALPLPASNRVANVPLEYPV